MNFLRQVCSVYFTRVANRVSSSPNFLGSCLAVVAEICQVHLYSEKQYRWTGVELYAAVHRLFSIWTNTFPFSVLCTRYRWCFWCCGKLWFSFWPVALRSCRIKEGKQGEVKCFSCIFVQVSRVYYTESSDIWWVAWAAEESSFCFFLYCLLDKMSILKVKKWYFYFWSASVLMFPEIGVRKMRSLLVWNRSIERSIMIRSKEFQ